MGYDSRHVLKVGMMLSQKIMSNYINHIANTPVDEPFQLNYLDYDRRLESPARSEEWWGWAHPFVVIDLVVANGPALSRGVG